MDLFDEEKPSLRWQGPYLSVEKDTPILTTLIGLFNSHLLAIRASEVTDLSVMEKTVC